jgi:hypothetical protein
MAQPKELHRPTTAKKKRGKKRSLLRGTTGKYMTVRKLQVSSEGLSAIARKGSIDKILKGYIAVAKRAKKVGRPLDYTVRVSPDGDAKLVAEPVAAPVTESDALESALTAARERGQVKVAEILKGDDMLTASDFGSLIGASHETVNVKRGRGEVLGLQGATRAVRYPRWQVTDAGLPLPGLSRLFEVLGRQPWTVYRFLRTVHAELGGRTALDALKAGQQEAVLGVAQNQMNGVFS